MSFFSGTSAGQTGGNTGFGFGAPKTTAATGSFTFNAPAATTSGTSFSFGSTPNANAPSGGTNLGFGATGQSATPAVAAVAPSFNFGGSAAPTSQPGAAPAFSFSTPAASNAGAAGTTTGFGLGGLGGTTSFNFGGSSAAPTLGAQTATTSSGFGLGGGLFGKPATTATATGMGLNFGNTPTTSTLSLGASGSLFDKNSTATPFVGLGGIDTSSSQPKTGGSIKDIKEKETLVPEEIAKTIEALKNYIKHQKQLSSDIGRTSATKLSKVSNEIGSFQLALQKIENSVAQNYQATQALKRETSRVNAAVDMAAHTKDTPPGLQMENNAPFKYFEELVLRYEHDLTNIKQIIAATENHMRSISNPSSITGEDFKRCLQQINESFISLAGRIHEIHQKVEAEKEEYLKSRRLYLNDNTDIFENLKSNLTKPDTLHMMGRTPFTNLSGISSLSYMYSNMTTAGSNVTNHPQAAK